MFDKILIANRGEIAVRVIRTARRLGVRTVAVYSEADVGAMHVELADEAIYIGAAPARESYLRGDVILDAVRRSGAQAVHPGYGFLSENAEFAAACAASDVVFIGPPVAAIHAMGSKAESKRLMAAAGVPLVPGYHDSEQDLARLTQAANRIGYPVLVKASAGGGGKGMRIVLQPDDLEDAVLGAKREAKAAFGDDSLLLEKYLTQTRHVEVQVFADTQGQCVYLFDRDCSLQRRHQKVIEEAPAPNLPSELRQRMGHAAVAAAQAVNYVGAGTVEFMYAGNEFYFIEMNTRLQVEHPVTEMITGLDLVEWQLRVASGEPLPLRQDQLSQRGHALETRIYAEDPARNFLPSIGTLTHLRAPAEDRYVRVDTGVRCGDAISMHYDPMIAKLIVWGEDRATALRHLRRALEAYEIAGVSTNLGLLGAIAQHREFAAVQIDTAFIERHRAELLSEAAPPHDELLALAALRILLGSAVTIVRTDKADLHSDPYSPWRASNGWQLNLDNLHELVLTSGVTRRQIVVHFRPGGYELQVDGKRRIAVTGASLKDDTLHAVLDGVHLSAVVIVQNHELTLLHQGRSWHLHLDDPMANAADQEASVGRLTAPMPGKVIAVLVKVGQAVERGHALIVLEAMKMEHTVVASSAGMVTAVRFNVGDKVNDGDELLKLETKED